MKDPSVDLPREDVGKWGIYGVWLELAAHPGNRMDGLARPMVNGESLHISICAQLQDQVLSKVTSISNQIFNIIGKKPFCKIIRRFHRR